ncbi:MAG: hypothetical protein HQ477_13255 [Chloroflexi bacterium]|jgi:hypothetical protein|nr:hypothetical protein [Chloroflexota bacterium]
MPQDKEQIQPPVEPEDRRLQSTKDDASKSGEELKINRLKFMLILAAILLFALIASNIKDFLSGN